MKPHAIDKTIIYKDKNVELFIDKPIWKNLTKNVELCKKSGRKANPILNKEIWIEGFSGNIQKVDINKIECIIQHHDGRSKNIYIVNQSRPFSVSLS